MLPSVQSTWEAEDLSHNMGRRERDAEALNGVAWAVRQGDDGAGGCLVWGPYEPLQPGEYAVAFRVKASGAGGGEVAMLDVFDYVGGRVTGKPTLAQASVSGEAGGFRDVWLRFRVEQPLRAEYRVTWRGVGEMSVDRIVVVRLREPKP